MTLSNHALSASHLDTTPQPTPAGPRLVQLPGPEVRVVRGGQSTAIDKATIADIATLGELVQRLRARVGSERDVICRIDVDGAQVDDTSSAWTAVTLSAAQQIRLHVEDLGVLLADAMREAEESLTRARGLFVDAAWGLRLEEVAAFTTLADAAESLQGATPFVQAALNMIPEGEAADRLARFGHALNRAVEDVHAAQQSGDNLAVADSIEANLVPALESWRETSQGLLEALSAGR